MTILHNFDISLNFNCVTRRRVGVIGTFVVDRLARSSLKTRLTMVSATVVTVGTVIASPGCVVWSAAAEGAVVGLITSTFGAGTPSSVAGAIGTAASTGAITGAIVGGAGTAKTAAIGAAVAGSAATGISATSAGMAGVTAGVFSGAALWLVLGTELSEDGPVEQHLSFDCWKPLLRDTSSNPSKGMLLRDVLMDPRIKNVDVSYDTSAQYPQMKLQNVWGENFKIEYVRLPWNKMAAHAVPM